jgi:hypothetical protein
VKIGSFGSVVKTKKKKKKKKKFVLRFLWAAVGAIRTHEATVKVFALMSATTDLFAIELLATGRRSGCATTVHCGGFFFVCE